MQPAPIAFPADQSSRPPRQIFFGMSGQFSLPPMLALLEARIPICAVVVPAAQASAAPANRDIWELKPVPLQASLPIINPYLSPNIVQLAWQHAIPVFAVRRLAAPATLQTLRALAPEAGCVACFNRRLPPALLELPRFGFFNIHPSLLPAYRGPAPLFWNLRDGTPTGVSVHMLDHNLDTGPLAAQMPVTLPDGITGEQADQLLGAQGGRLMIDVLVALQANTLVLQPQAQAGTDAPWPSADDFAISTTWPAQRCFNFMRATDEWQQLYPLQIGTERFLLAAALSYTTTGTLPTPFRRHEQTLSIQCTPGVLHATLAQ